MANPVETLWSEAGKALQAGKPDDAMCYLAEIISADPMERRARLALALALGNAGSTASALKIVRLLAERLAHEGQLLAAIVVVRHGLEHAGDDPGLVQILQRIHVRGVRAKAGNLVVPPPLRQSKAPTAAVTAAELLQLEPAQRMARVAEVGCDLPPAGPAVVPVPLPLFCELDSPTFVEVVKHLRYKRAPTGTRLLEEGTVGDTLLVLATGHAEVTKGGTVLAQLGPSAVLGEMALITSAPRSATVTATEPVEYFELSRADVRQLAKLQPTVADELQAYCRSRLLQNLLRRSPLFARFDEATRIDILGQFKTTTFEAAEGIIIQGQPSPGLYLIASGDVDVTIANPEGDMVKVATLGVGEVFGEISLLKNQPATAFVTARTTVGALVLAAEEFQRLLQKHPGVREYLEGLSADRLKASREVLEAGIIDADDLIVL